MKATRLITLLSDFGLSDAYVAVIKGVIATINPALRVIDLTHQLPPQNILAGQFSLLNAYPYFPAGTVHLAVVDPGVGSSRRAVAIERTDGFLVGPDNGLFTGLLDQPGTRVVELTNPAYWRVPQPSQTFHGRDIFAAVAAHLASGLSLLELGDPLDPQQLVRLPLATCTTTSTGYLGRVQSIDRFGNLITNIPGAAVAGKAWSVLVGHAPDSHIPSCRSYSERAVGEALALVGSHGWVELAVNGGDAQAHLGLGWGDPVQVVVSLEP